MSSLPFLSTQRQEKLRQGLVIPAHPLALNNQRQFDEKNQRVLTRYYHAAGARGLAFGVHTTQFAIRDTRYNLFRPVLELGAETAQLCDQQSNTQTILIAGIIGKTAQAVTEARTAYDLGYHVGLLSLSSLQDATEKELITHVRAVAAEIPLFGFYLQAAVGGRPLSRNFWREFALIENVVGIKIAPFNRYATLDVVHGVVQSGRINDIALYTGNDDAILYDLLTEYKTYIDGKETKAQIVGGLLGHWAVWTRTAVNHLEMCKNWIVQQHIPPHALTLAAQITDCNAAFFDAANNYAGCIAGLHEVLRRQGIIDSNFCLNPNESLSHDQAQEIDRVYQAYPHLNDDSFIKAHIDHWRR